MARKSGVLLTYEGITKDDADCSISCAKMQFIMAMNGDKESLQAMNIEGDAGVLQRLVKYMSEYKMDFNIIEP